MLSSSHLRAPAASLVDVAWLRAHREDVVLLQVDDDSAAYYDGHLPGALPVATYDELHEQVRRGPVGQRNLELLMQRKGVCPGDHVVLYSAGDGSHAAFGYWLMRYYRHERLSLLDGGLRAWVRAGGGLQTTVPDAPEVGPYASPGRDPSLVLDRDELLERYVDRHGDVLLLDCRRPAEYEGSGHHQLDLAVERHRVSGHIAGARNLSADRLLAGPAFRPLEELRALFASVGVVPGSDVAVYCRVAERSSLVWFALSEMLGHPLVRHYVGGWAEYGSLLDVPVARG